MNKFFTFLLVSLLFTGLFCYAQPPAFTVTGTTNPQTCLGNGSITLTVTGNDPDATMEYAVYLLPNTTVPVTIVTVPAVTGLIAGNYQIVATQLLNGSSNTAVAFFTVEDTIAPLQYTLTGNYCGGSGTITVNVTSGNPETYEILNGPVTAPPQPSNVFTGLPQGQYQVRVFDTCGEGLVTTVQLTAPLSDLWLTAPMIASGELPSCNTIVVHNGYGNNLPMLFPVTFQFRVYPPNGGTPTVVNTTQAAYNSTQTVSAEIPYYATQDYSYILEMTDACGNSIERTFVVSAPPELLIMPMAYGCGNYGLDMSINHYVAPYTVNFLAAPAGFVPTAYNSQHPTFSSSGIIYGAEDNPVPLGSYNIQITDACGRIFTTAITIDDDVTPEFSTSFEGTTSCTGTINISLPGGRAIVSGQITQGPPGFAPLPQDVTAFIENGTLTIPGLPPGNYTVVFTDQCGSNYTVYPVINVPPVLPLVIEVMPGCGPDEGTFFAGLYGFFYGLESAFITQAPATYNQSLPHDVSANIHASGALYMDGLPAGSYHLTTTDYCGNVREADVNIQGYQVYNSNVTITRNCGSFDVGINFSSNNSNNSQFWLQVYNEETGYWEHPATGIPYTGGDLNAGVAAQLYNNQVNFNFPYEGEFRVMHTVFVYDAYNESFPYKYCTEQIYTFSFYDAPSIVEAYAFPCNNGLSEVVVYAEGVAPLTYQITQKNGEPFVVNGQGNVFTALEDASYIFTVTDACNNIVNRQYDVTDLKALEIIPEGFCPGEISSLRVREFSFLTYEWWKATNPSQILSTTNILEFPAFDPQTQAGQYFLKIESTTPGSCIDTVIEYTILSNPLPNSGNDVSVSFCSQAQEVDLATLLDADVTPGGTWQDTQLTGALSGSVVSLGNLEPGNYTFSYTTASCNSTDEAIVNLEMLGDDSFEVLLVADCVDDNYTITISNLDAIDAETIAWTGPGGFNAVGETATITGLAAGEYTATVTNASGCVSTGAVTVSNTNCFIPRGISPGDGEGNETFDLSNLGVKHLIIYNRYGMQVYEKDNYLNEWHGQSDKGDLPTGTYFYVITLANKQVTGWVYLLKRV